MPDSPHTGNQDRIDAAIAHLTQGFAAFSVWSTTSEGTCKCVKGVDCISPGKHPIPRNGFKAASTDPETVRIMLGAGSNPNYGLVAPEGSDIITMDVDGADWKAKIGDLIAKYGPLPATKTTRTPSGGLHLFYRWPEGVDMPDGDEFHGFVTRFPWRGYVVGPGSAINGSVYAQTGPTNEIAVLPVAWTEGLTAVKQPLITVTDAKPGYEMPLTVETGHRHDEIARLVASMWNRKVAKDMIWPVVVELSKRFVEPMDEPRLIHEFNEAYATAGRKWDEPAGGTREGTTSDGGQTETPSTHGGSIEVGLLDAAIPTVPLSMRAEAITTAAPLAQLMDHWTPRTDASFESLLVQTLVYAGTLFGHDIATFYGSREQHANVFAILVGTTSMSRKGTSADLVRGVWQQVSDAARGLTQSPNSGEGVIRLASEAKGAPVLIYEEEFARFLAAKGRDYATLSPIMRQAFDDVPLSSVTSARTLRAEIHHIAMIAHITDRELSDTFGGVDLTNGFANRMAWIGTFPRPVTVSIHDNDLSMHLRDDLREVVSWVSKIRRPLVGGSTHQMTDPARAMLLDAGKVYNAGVGLAPFLSRRLDTIAARLALIYACFDQSRVIEPIHVEAALAVTDYAHATTTWLWPATTGDLKADFVLAHLKDAGFLNGTALEALIGTKRPYDKQVVANKLMQMGYARKATRPRADGKPGRPQEGLEVI